MNRYFTPEECRLLLFILTILTIGSLIEYLSTPELLAILSKETESAVERSDEVGDRSVGLSLAPLDINQASADDFIALPGIGPALAGRILVARKKNGGFHTIDELLSIRGIGAKKFAAISELVACSTGDGEKREQKE